ncbi:MAG: GNAT family N-acetyltransferase [Anaerolineales bacterium]
MKWSLRVLETPEEMHEVEELQRLVWPGSETDVVPAHLLITAAHNGGLVIGAYVEEEGKPKLIGFVFGFPGLDMLPDGPAPKHCSHMLGVHPDYRESGLGFALKRAQWQMVRHQGLTHITWTYDPLLSRNAYLNIAKLGAVCNTYRRSEYGEMRDALNIGLPSDRFQVDWWIRTPRVERRLSRSARPRLRLEHFLQAGLRPLYEPTEDERGHLHPPTSVPSFQERLLLVEIPSDFNALKAEDLPLARDWRFFTRELFESAFAAGYLVTDFLFEPEAGRRSFYVLSYGESLLEG